MVNELPKNTSHVCTWMQNTMLKYSTSVKAAPILKYTLCKYEYIHFLLIKFWYLKTIRFFAKYIYFFTSEFTRNVKKISEKRKIKILKLDVAYFRMEKVPKTKPLRYLSVNQRVCIKDYYLNENKS